jgi:valyl-tRNA synthetase
MQAVITAARTVRSEHGLVKPPLPLRVRTDQATLAAELMTHTRAIESLVRTVGPVAVESASLDRLPGTVVTTVATERGTISVLVTLKGLVTRDEEEKRLDREEARIEKDIAALEKKLGSPGFVDRAPPEVVEEAKQQRASLLEALERIKGARALLGEL